MIPGYQDTWIPGYLDTRIPGYQDTWILGYLDTRIPGYPQSLILNEKPSKSVTEIG